MASHRTRPVVLSLLAAASIAAASQPALAANVLVVGSTPGSFVLRGYLENNGYTVSVVPFDVLPASIATYSTVWVHTTNSLAASDLAKLEAFVESGGGVYINGEWGVCCGGAGASANAEALVNATVAGASTITVGDGSTSISGNGTPNPTAVGGITQIPNAPPYMAVASAGRITGAAAVNQMVTSTGNVLAAAWSDGDMVSGKGRIVVVMDSNWIASASWEDAWVANLQRFLQNADSDGDGIPDIDDSCTDTDDDGFGDPFHPANTCTLDACPDVAGVAPDGCPAPPVPTGVLVVGSTPGSFVLRGYLENNGYTVSVVPFDVLPASIATYSTVWVHTTNSLAASDLAKLEAFVESGGGVYINGEWGVCCGGAGASANAEALVNATVVGASTITVGDGSTSISGNGTPNPTAVGGITQIPNAPPYMAVASAGRITGAAAVNQMVTSTGNVLAAAWSDGDMVSGKGRIVVVMDSNWIASASWEDAWVANLQRFLQNADSDGDGIPDIDDSCTDTDDDGFGDPFHPANTCTLDACPDVAGVAPDGCAAEVPGLSAAGRVLLGLIIVALATPVAPAAAWRSWIDPIRTRRARKQRGS